MLVLGLDIGTQSTKALLLDDGGRVQGSASVEYTIDTPRPGWAEQRPQTWWRAACESVRQVIKNAPEPVAAVGLSGQMHGAVLLGRHGDPIRPAILWTDARAGQETTELRAKVPELVGIAGNPIMAAFTAPKLLWLARHDPLALRDVRWCLLPKDYVRFRLTGEIATDPSDASGTLLFDLRRNDWARDIISRVGLDPCWFPPVIPSNTVAGYVTPEAMEQTGLKAGTPVIAGGADMAMAAVGAGLVETDLAGVLLSSAGQVLLTVESVSLDALGRAYYFAHVVPGRYLAMGALLTAGLSLRWLRDLIGSPSFGDLDKFASAVAPGGGGLLFLPYLAGTGTPHLDADARGAFIGLGLEHGIGALARAVMEGVAFGLRDSLDTVRLAAGQGPPDGPRVSQARFREIRVGGGGARSRVWLQILADVLGAAVVPLETADASPLGAALLALVSARAFTCVSEVLQVAVKVGEPVLPEPARIRRYAELYDVYRTTYPALRATFARLSAARGAGVPDGPIATP